MPTMAISITLNIMTIAIIPIILVLMMAEKKPMEVSHKKRFL